MILIENDSGTRSGEDHPDQYFFLFFYFFFFYLDEIFRIKNLVGMYL